MDGVQAGVRAVLIGRGPVELNILRAPSRELLEGAPGVEGVAGSAPLDPCGAAVGLLGDLIGEAAPVVVGIMERAAARARRISLCGRSRIRWSFVYECTVTICPLMMPTVSLSTLVMGARQLVVHEALETIRCAAGSNESVLMP